MAQADKTRNRRVEDEKPIEWGNSEGVKPEQAGGTFVPEDHDDERSRPHGKED